MKNPMPPGSAPRRCLSRWWWLPPCCWPAAGWDATLSTAPEVDARRVPGSVRAGTQPAPTSLGCCAWPCGDSGTPERSFARLVDGRFARRRPESVDLRPGSSLPRSEVHLVQTHTPSPFAPTSACCCWGLIFVHRPPGDRDPDRADQTRIGASDTMMGLLTGLAGGLLYAGPGCTNGQAGGSRQPAQHRGRLLHHLELGHDGLRLRAAVLAAVCARMTVAVGEAGGMAPSISMVSDMYPRRQRSLVIGLFMMGPHFGVLIGLAVGGWIAQHHGWRAAFLWFGAPGACRLLVWLLVREPVRGGSDGSAEPQRGCRCNRVAVGSVAPAVGRPRVRHICWAAAWPAWLATACHLDAGFLMRTHGLTLAHAGLLGLWPAVWARWARMPFSGWACDRFVRRDLRWQLGLRCWRGDRRADGVRALSLARRSCVDASAR